MTEWTVDDVASRLTDAAETARRLPPVRVQGYFNLWPAFAREQWESFGADEPRYRHLPPTPDAIERMLETMGWMLWIEAEQRHLLWMRARQHEWQEIGRRFGCCRTTVWRRWKIAINQITVQLNDVHSSKLDRQAG